MFLNNASSPALTSPSFNIDMHETVAVPISHILAPTGSFSVSILLFISIQLLAYFAPLIYKHYVLHYRQRAQELSILRNALAEIRDKVNELEETIARDLGTHVPWPAPNPALIQSVTDDGGQFSEFGSPPSLDEDNELMLPSPAIDAIEGHAALESFYQRNVVYTASQGQGSGEELGPVARNPILSALLKRLIEERAGLQD